MKNSRHIGYLHRHASFSYPLSLRQTIYSLFLLPIGVLLLAFAVTRGFGAVHVSTEQITLAYFLAAIGATFLRLAIAFGFALILSVPLALLVTRSRFAEQVFLPVFDIIQSIPVLAFFPIIILFFVHYGLYSGAAIFILFVAMLWNLVFSLVGGMHSIPADIKSAGVIFGVRGLSYLWKILIPAIVPYLITGSLLAWAQGWNIVIVAEVLHTYLPGGLASSDVFGIGSVLVNASSSGDERTFFTAIVVMIVTIALLNFFVWQRLLRYAERFKFE
jgi:NitT/TauT family transport system permease protein